MYLTAGKQSNMFCRVVYILKYCKFQPQMALTKYFLIFFLKNSERNYNSKITRKEAI